MSSVTLLIVLGLGSRRARGRAPSGTHTAASTSTTHSTVVRRNTGVVLPANDILARGTSTRAGVFSNDKLDISEVDVAPTTSLKSMDLDSDGFRGPTLVET
ncbi:hypothetical protein B0T14DRAFT_514386 [Immersiella caudata]|uniref:Secreted protein n=1 Tax=Immersiella caudata TaxID=314043 RepID=A0AA40C395_9PEZI|nr:hypothetical protein B0T14DRAFT_514386 [Immersiella caudata]